MGTDDPLKDAIREAAKLPPTTGAERLRFEHLRADFREAFRQARGERPASAVDTVVDLATRVFRHLGEALQFPGQEFALARSAGAARPEATGEQVVWALAGGLEALLWLTPGDGGATWLEVDLLAGYERERPYRVSLLDADGAELGNRQECLGLGDTLRVLLPAPGRYTLELEHAGQAAHLALEVAGG